MCAARDAAAVKCRDEIRLVICHDCFPCWPSSIGSKQKPHVSPTRCWSWLFFLVSAVPWFYPIPPSGRPTKQKPINGWAAVGLSVPIAHSRRHSRYTSWSVASPGWDGGRGCHTERVTHFLPGTRPCFEQECLRELEPKDAADIGSWANHARCWRQLPVIASASRAELSLELYIGDRRLTSTSMPCFMRNATPRPCDVVHRGGEKLIYQSDGR